MENCKNQNNEIILDRTLRFKFFFETTFIGDYLYIQKNQYVQGEKRRKKAICGPREGNTARAETDMTITIGYI